MAKRIGLHRRLALRLGLLAIRATLLVSPRPAAALLRRLFAYGGAATARGLARHDPGGVDVRRDERYGAGADSVLDVYRPAGREEALPLVVWIHGGGWLAGSKEELAGFFRLIAARGHAVAAPRYSLAPKHPYPTALRQVMEALAYLSAHAERLGVDPGLIVIAGDSAGAQLAAQTAALVTTPGYAEAVGVPATIAPEQLRGVALACGAYDLSLLTEGSGLGQSMATAILWSYSGHRGFQRDESFAMASVADHLSSGFPPALVTVGNADPLRAHSIVLGRRLRELGVPVDALFFPDDHQPPLGHEYQFDLDTEAGRRFLERLTAFLARRLRA
jgi:acetyl esterase/lipase